EGLAKQPPGEVQQAPLGVCRQVLGGDARATAEGIEPAADILESDAAGIVLGIAADGLGESRHALRYGLRGVLGGCERCVRATGLRRWPPAPGRGRAPAGRRPPVRTRSPAAPARGPVLRVAAAGRRDSAPRRYRGRAGRPDAAPGCWWEPRRAARARRGVPRQ